MKDGKYQILLSNDDGIRSPGLWAAAKALSAIGYVTVAAPREQSTSTGRSYAPDSPGTIEKVALSIGDEEWTCYAVAGTPAQAVQHALLEIMDTTPDLVVAGINYGENIGNSLGISGTIGAAMEAASVGIKALATSLEIGDQHSIFSHSTEVDFSTAAYFTALIARLMLTQPLPFDVDLLKLDVPCDATPETPWSITRVTRQRYFMPRLIRQGGWDGHGEVGYKKEADLPNLERDSDVYKIAYERTVSVSALSLDNTARTDLAALDRQLHQALEEK